jgi:hypothetical protein
MRRIFSKKWGGNTVLDLGQARRTLLALFQPHTRLASLHSPLRAVTLGDEQAHVVRQIVSIKHFKHSQT